MAGFSEKSLEKIRAALRTTPAGNDDFSMQLSSDEISAHYLWSEGISIRFEEGKYICTQHLERATRHYEIPDEEQAVAKFVDITCHRKAEILKY